jgi:hypothetical protein
MTTTTNLTALIQQACELKAQMNGQMLLLYTRLTEPESFEQQRGIAGKVLARQYAPAIRDIIAATTQDDLLQRRRKIEKRLNGGWDYLDANPAQEDAYAAWEALLLEYSVIQDALDHIGVINGTQDRIDWIAQYVAPMEQGVLV